MKDWSIIWPFISTILALAVGWGLTQTSTWLTGRQADKRVLKEALYFLLELHYQLTNIQRSGLAMHVSVNSLLENEPDEDVSELRTHLVGILRPLMRTAANPILMERLAGLKEGYQACLLKLAAVDPLNASLLRGQEEVLLSIDRMVGLMQNPEAHGLNFPAPTAYQLAKFRQHLDDKLLPKSTKLLLSVITELAEAIGGPTKQKLMDVLAKRAKNEAEIEEELKDFLTDLPKAFAEH